MNWHNMRNVIILLLISFVYQSFGQDFTYKEKKDLKGFPDYIMEAGFSPYRNFFAITIGNNTLEVYDKNWKKIFTHQGNPKAVGGHFSFSPDEKYLAYAKYKSNSDVAIIRLEDRKVIQVIPAHAGYIYDIEYSNNGKYLATSSQDKTAKIWQWKDDEFILLQTIPEHDNSVAAVSFSFDDKFFASVGDSKKIIIHELQKEKFKLIHTLSSHKTYIRGVAFHPNKHEFISGSSYGLRLWSKKGNNFTMTDSITEKISVNGKLSYGPKGELIVFGNYSMVKIVRNKNGLKLIETIYRHGDNVFSGSFSDDGKFLTTFSSDRSAIVWEITGVKPSDKSLLADYLGVDLTSAQKQILTSEVLTKTFNRLSKEITLPRDEFETSEQYTKRRKKLSSKVLSILQEYTEVHYNIKYDMTSGDVKIPISQIIGYNADLEIYKIRFLETEAGVEIPIPDAKEFKASWKKAYVKAKRKVSEDKTSYSYSDFQLVHPSNGKLYSVTPIENPFHAEKNEKSNRRDKNINTVTMNETKEKLEDNIAHIDRALLFATGIYDSFSDLVNPVLDATTISNELQDNFHVQTELIINPTLDETISKIRQYAELSYNPKDNLVIFFAGHGNYDEVFKEGYVINRDSKYDDVAKTSYLSHSNLRTMINNIPCKHIFLVMDVCFGGTFDPLIASKSRSADMYADIDNEDFVNRKKKYKTRLYLTSGGNEYVPDGRPGHHSPFARKFLEALRNYGGTDGILTMNEIIQFIEKVDPQPRFGEFGDNEPGSDFLMIAK